MFDVFKEYIKNRKLLKSNTKRFYIKKILFPFFLIAPIIYIINFTGDIKIEHKSIATALVSVTAIIVAFLIFSMTILLTKENTKTLKNNPLIKYNTILINNTEVHALISFITILLNLFYMYTANINLEDNYLLILSYLSLYLTIFIIKMAIDDILFLSDVYKKE